jgi:hypothetical protein
VRTSHGFAQLRHQGFRLLAAGQLAPNLSDARPAVASPWYVTAGHGKALLLATAVAAYGVPRTALALIGGHAAGRWHPWTVMTAAHAVCAHAAAALNGFVP